MANEGLVEDFFGLEPLLLARLTELFPDIAVQAGNDLNDLRARRHLTPTIYITYQNYVLEENQPNLRQARIKQTWLIIMAMQCLWYSQSNVAARPQTGNLLSRVVRGLHGWEPPRPYGRLALASPPVWELSENNAAYPIAFSSTFTVLGIL